MGDFEDLLKANDEYTKGFVGKFTGKAQKGVAVITCMDSRIEPLDLLGLELGDAKILRSPGGRVTPDVLTGCILGTHLLGVDRILVIQHTRCAMASGTNAEIADAIVEANKVDLRGMTFGANPDQDSTLAFDVRLLKAHPALKARTKIGGFLYDVDNGSLVQVH